MAQSDFSAWTRLKALGCAICPFCIAARKWPRSRYAGSLRSIEKACPFCRAYARVHGGGSAAGPGEENGGQD